MSALRQGWKQSPLRFLIKTTQNRMSRSKSADSLILPEPAGSTAEFDRLSGDEELDPPGVTTRGRDKARQQRLAHDGVHVEVANSTPTLHLRQQTPERRQRYQSPSPQRKATDISPTVSTMPDIDKQNGNPTLMDEQLSHVGDKIDWEGERNHWKLIDRSVKKIKNCNGVNTEHVREWLRAISHSQLSDVDKIHLARETARERLLTELQKNQWVGYAELREWVLDNFVAHNFVRQQRQALRKIHQDPREPLRSFNWRFSDLVEEAYPRGANSEESVIDAYLAALYSERCVEKILENGENPISLTQAMNKAQVYDKIAEIKSSAGRETRVNRVAGLREERQNVIEDDDDDISTLKAKVAALTRDVEKLTVVPVTHDKSLINTSTPQPTPAPVELRAMPPPTNLSYRANTNTPPQGIVCYNCGQKGHVQRQCGFPRRNLTTQGKPVCYRCQKVGHFIRDCKTPNDRQPASARFVGYKKPVYNDSPQNRQPPKN